MTCRRCRGLMFREAVSARRRWLWLWACFACGDRIDETIQFHRAMRDRETSAARHDRIMRELQLLVGQSTVGL